MRIELGSFKGEGGVPISTISYVSDDSRADVVVLHGYGEHADRYRHVAKRLAADGYDVHLPDHRGHGRSGGRFGYVDRFDALVRDAEYLVDQVRAQGGGRPLFVLGHSMGGLATLLLLARGEARVDAAVTTGAFVEPGGGIPDVMVEVAKWLGRVMPLLPMQSVDASCISRDPAVVEAYLTDALVYSGKVAARTGSELLHAQARLREAAPKIDQPLLMLHGEADALAEPRGSSAIYEAAGSTDKTLRFYPGLFHEIMNEPEQDDVLDDIVAWLGEHRS